ncbi:MAG: RNase adapter RapZ [Firmicutes bacterium]|nr:RNase adapter RapZ [Bacillota bacterium]
MDFVIVTGLSGAGKTEAARSFEDLGFFCIDNLPPMLVPKFTDLVAQSGGNINRIALVIDIRGGKFFNDVFDVLEGLESRGIRYSILFLEASDEALVRRFKESRRRHPLAPEGSILEGITLERKRLQELRGRATHIINTTDLKPRELREKIKNIFGNGNFGDKMHITVTSFGFKYGLPIDADLTLDVRFLPNPHYVDSLRPQTGLDKAVSDYVTKWPVTQQYLEKLQDFLGFQLPLFVNEGRSELMIAVGCTGGRHRSVTIAERLGAFFRGKGFPVTIEHRDIEK